MRVFVYECITGGGWFRWSPGQPPTGSLYQEGQAMVEALVDDLLKMQLVEVTVLRDARLPAWESVGLRVLQVHEDADHGSAFDQAVRESDAAIVIAPEFQQILQERSQRVCDLQGRLASPDPQFVQLASDKAQTLDWLGHRGVRVPKSVTVHSNHDLRLWFDQVDRPSGPLVMKPRDGAGSIGLHYYVECPSIAEIAARMSSEPTASGWCIQEFRAGSPASVAAVGSGRDWSLLPPCWQHLDPETWTYLGGSTIEEEAVMDRAIRLAEQVFAALPPARGYVGIDLVLGDDESGVDDYVIEVNPRLTTSYVGLRHAVHENLAARMVNCEPFDGPRHIQKRGCSIKFSADGRVWRDHQEIPTSRVMGCNE